MTSSPRTAGASSSGSRCIPAFCPLCLLEASLDPPTKRDLGFRRIQAPGFDLYLDATQHIWPKTMEFALRRRRRVEAYWNGLAWLA